MAWGTEVGPLNRCVFAGMSCGAKEVPKWEVLLS